MTPDNLRSFINDNHLTIADMGLITGKSDRMVQLWLSGDYPIPLLVKILVKALTEKKLTFEWVVAQTP